MKKTLFAITALAVFFAQPVAAENIGVTSSADPRVTDAGMEMLRQGGSAADAAMAMMLTLTVVEPQSSGIGGGGFLLYQDNAKGILSTINGRETAPAAATSDRFVGPNGKPLGFLEAFQGGRSVGVPGNVQLMAQAHQKWGKLPWATIFKPAIRLSQKGFIVNKTLESRLAAIQGLWPNFDEARTTYWRDGKPLKAGMTFKNPKLAATLALLAKKGSDAFYTGPIASQIVYAVTTSKLSPGDMTMTDLAQYRAKEQQAVCAPYRVYVVCGMAPPSSGATTVLQILGTLQRFDLSAIGKDSPQSWYLIGQAMQLAYADREKYLGDDAFVNVPVAGLLNPEYIKERSALIDPEKARADYPAGNPPGAAPRTAAISSEVAGTTHFTAVDKNGNIANMTSTIEGPFGSQLMAGGFFLNNELTDFTFAPEKDGAPVANRVVGGKRPLSSMAPTVVFDRDGRAVLALGSAGGKRIIMHVTKTLIGVIEFGLPLQQAIDLPNMYFGGGGLEVEQNSMLSAMADGLGKFGQKVRPVDLGSKVNGAQRIGNSWTGAADPRSEGTSATIDANGKVKVTVPRSIDEAPTEDVG
ncbi:gamma-glutamyltransferase [Sphingorhabdus sp.]|jgi:gamma-glutamyltranspeptidase/glutathione hydrolase|uniref:gamma-glutamyltransferase n=1 Tax=Sphingorhabdus sp. TaxID=1902408 RepID=UPI00262BACEA|nr:gamma-glutamyltransferase [Sphingorhabdus sp.]MDH4398911.1 gamma-glutamyltransferase [Sphingorhabdus sp.]